MPTVDIHTSQIGWEKHWLYFLKEYILPYTSKVFIGHSAEVNTTEASVEHAAVLIIILRFLPSSGYVSVAVGFPFPCCSVHHLMAFKHTISLYSVFPSLSHGHTISVFLCNMFLIFVSLSLFILHVIILNISEFTSRSFPSLFIMVLLLPVYLPRATLPVWPRFYKPSTMLVTTYHRHSGCF